MIRTRTSPCAGIGLANSDILKGAFAASAIMAFISTTLGFVARSMRARATAADLDLAGEEQRNRGDREHDADHRERVAEAEDERLAVNGRADGGDRLLLGHSRIGDAVRLEVLHQAGDA